MVEEFTGHPMLVDFMAGLIRKCNVRARDEEALARCVQRFSAKAIKYFHEQPERWQSPLRTIAWRVGDCDDKTILIASMLRSFRIPVRAVFLRMTLKDGRRMAHVYPQAKIQGKWTSLESVREVPVGFDFAEKARAKGIPFETETIGDT